MTPGEPFGLALSDVVESRIQPESYYVGAESLNPRLECPSSVAAYSISIVAYSQRIIGIQSKP